MSSVICPCVSVCLFACFVCRKSVCVYVCVCVFDGSGRGVLSAGKGVFSTVVRCHDLHQGGFEVVVKVRWERLQWGGGGADTCRHCTFDCSVCC